MRRSWRILDMLRFTSHQLLGGSPLRFVDELLLLFRSAGLG
jgi:hypothetical protein